jgi:hypothetical protein
MKKISIAIFFTAGFICSVLLPSCGNTIDDTGTPAFQVYEAIPANGATDVPPTTVISISLSADIDESTATTSTVVLKDSKGQSVSGEVIANGITVAFAPGRVTTDESGEKILTPVSLNGSETYTLTITTQLKDISGRSLAVDYTTRFTTASE